MRTEKGIRDRIASLNERQKSIGVPDTDVYRIKVILRAQIKGLKFALGENYSIMGDD